ncbi:unnamed protein product [Linum trigynum]|uniref:Uncharacterized protein n=1 Tax=Linum trigynum TaxID=586398 RepID=A0AAV2ECS4_9ROSI
MQHLHQHLFGPNFVGSSLPNTNARNFPLKGRSVTRPQGSGRKSKRQKVENNSPFDSGKSTTLASLNSSGVVDLASIEIGSPPSLRLPAIGNFSNQKGKVWMRNRLGEIS